MKEVTKKRWGHFGWFCMSFVPMLGYIVLTIGVSAVFAVIVGIGAIMGGATDYGDVMNQLLDSTMMIGAVYAVLGLVCFGLWYYFGCKRKQLRIPRDTFDAKTVAALILLAFGTQFVVGYLMLVIQVVAPGVIDSYVEMMELAGLTDIDWMGVLYAVILGPIAEEMVFRGVTFFYAKKATSRFWLANTIQALAFGIMHMNVVQGIYAFLVGLLLGWIYERFHSLYASILVHILFNFMGTCVLEGVENMMGDSLIVYILWNVLGVVAFVASILLLRRKKNGFMEEA